MFGKYTEIENSYRSKHIDRFRQHCDIDKEKYVVLEKLHGSNFSICVTADGDVSYRSRKRELDPNEKFFNYMSAVDKINLNGIVSSAVANGVNIQAFAELYGDGINKGVDYSRDKNLRFFDVKVDNLYLSFDLFIAFTESLNLPTVPVVAQNVPLEEALAFDVESFRSMVNPDAPGDNIAEGVVIKPMVETWYGHDRFILKKKSKQFTEKKQKPKKPKKVDPVVAEWKPCVEQFVTEARMSNIFSKEGAIEDPKQIGHYIKLFMEDLYKDFIKEYPEFKEVDLDKKQKKAIMNVQSDAVKMLQEEL